MTEPKRILVIMLRRIGDVLLTTPAVRALRKRFPKAEIDFLVESPAHEMLAGNNDLTRVLIYDGHGPLKYLYWLLQVRMLHYDWVIDYMGNPRTAMLTFASGAAVKAGPGHVSHRWAYNHLLKESSTPHYSAEEKIRTLASLGIDADSSDHLPSVAGDAESEEFANKALARMRIPRGSIIGIVPASRRITRQWPAHKYAELGRRLRDSLGAHLIIFWGPGERELAEEVRNGIGTQAFLGPETKSLRHLAALIGRCRLVVTNCNGPRHIAVARSVPTVTVHGSSDPVLWNPPGNENHTTIRHEKLDCIGCQKNRCPYALECMNDLSAAEVFAAVNQQFSRTAA
jgi:heptosyltransferase-3